MFYLNILKDYLDIIKGYKTTKIGELHHAQPWGGTIQFSMVMIF